MRPTSTLLATALATVTLASPATAQDSPRPLQWKQHPSQDFRSPDARDAAAAALIAEPTKRGYRDLRSPDARDAAEGRTIAPVYQDLRTPDARDAADGRSMAATPVIEITRASGFDWGDAVIGAGGVIGMLALSLAGAMTLRRHRSSRALI